MFGIEKLKSDIQELQEHTGLKQPKSTPLPYFTAWLVGAFTPTPLNKRIQECEKEIAALKKYLKIEMVHTESKDEYKPIKKGK